MVQLGGERSNNAFKPKLLRYVKGMAGKACHAFASTTQFGLTYALGFNGDYVDISVQSNKRKL